MNRSVRLLGCIALLTPLLVAPRAQADKPVPHPTAFHTPCGQRVIENPFAQWNDVADYFLAPGGEVVDWDLQDAEIVAQNNPFSSHGAVTAAVQLSTGQSATTPMVCVTPDDPTMRFFVRNTGSELGTLHVDVLYQDSRGRDQALEIGTVTSADAGDAWGPSPVLELAAPLVAELANGLTEVNFRFSAEGAGSTWLVDDVYVDPYGKG
jgi:hypothetical protein